VVTAVANNEGVVRKVLVVALALAVQGAAVAAPFVHAHPEAHPTGHHAGRAVHTHWAGHDRSHHLPEGPAIGAADADRFVSLSAFVAVAARPLSAPGVPPGVFHVTVPAERAAHDTVDVVHSHGPPPRGSIVPRAPPVFPS
jgi:hypothetical protein